MLGKNESLIWIEQNYYISIVHRVANVLKKPYNMIKNVMSYQHKAIQNVMDSISHRFQKICIWQTSFFNDKGKKYRFLACHFPKIPVTVYKSALIFFLLIFWRQNKWNTLQFKHCRPNFSNFPISTYCHHRFPFPSRSQPFVI